MRISLRGFLAPPHSPNLEQAEEARLLHVMLLGTLGITLYFTAQNFDSHQTRSVLALSLLAATCIVGVYLNHQMHFRSAGLIFCASALGVIDYTLFDGNSLYDPGVAAFPVFILCTTFIFGKRGSLLATILCIVSLAALYLLEPYHTSPLQYTSSPIRVFAFSLLFSLLALVAATIRDAWEKHLVQVQQAYDQTLQGWAKALEYRDGETEGHSRRVTTLCVALARKLGCGEEEIQDIQRGAYLHDIGKMAIPDRILRKPGPLDDEEWKIMHQHPDLAYKMIADIPFLQTALTIPISHHERWDGSGYPKGLKGAEIPLAARIFTVVDQWDALSADRPYRRAWPREQVISYLKENAGKIYDPRIVQVFLDMLVEDATNA